jgi:hypothetical protein
MGLDTSVQSSVFTNDSCKALPYSHECTHNDCPLDQFTSSSRKYIHDWFFKTITTTLWNETTPIVHDQSFVRNHRTRHKNVDHTHSMDTEHLRQKTRSLKKGPYHSSGSIVTKYTTGHFRKTIKFVKATRCSISLFFF